LGASGGLTEFWGSSRSSIAQFRKTVRKIRCRRAMQGLVFRPDHPLDAARISTIIEDAGQDWGVFKHSWPSHPGLPPFRKGRGRMGHPHPLCELDLHGNGWATCHHSNRRVGRGRMGHHRSLGKLDLLPVMGERPCHVPARLADDEGSVTTEHPCPSKA
jgi:hypothetical protein